MTRYLRHVPPGAVVHQGDGTLDARIFQTVHNVVNVTVEDRAAILAEVGQALRPVLAELIARVDQLERDKRALTDTLASLMPARKHHLDATSTPARCDVGTQPDEEPHPASWPAEPPVEAISYAQPSLLEELRRG